MKKNLFILTIVGLLTSCSFGSDSECEVTVDSTCVESIETAIPDSVTTGEIVNVDGVEGTVVE